jgi:hypothetical protein
MQFSGKSWENEFWNQGLKAGYESNKTIYAIQNYSPIEAPASSVFAFEPSISEVEISVDDLLNYLPVSKPAADLTMTMAGWTFTTPFSHSRFTGRAVDMALVGLVFATITSIFTTINLISTWRFLRGRGARHQKELFPIFLISAFISLRLLLLVSPILTAGFIMLLADRHFLTAFFTIRAGGDVLLFQHIF